MAIVANQTHAIRQPGKFANKLLIRAPPKFQALPSRLASFSNLLTTTSTNMVNAQNGNPAAPKRLS
jgi:hypothetical protein